MYQMKFHDRHHMRRGPTLVYCWSNVVDGGPTVNQRWANVLYFLGGIIHNLSVEV